jgi:hypothetical protein
MPFFEITGIRKESGRKLKPRRYFAKNDTIAIRQAKKDGIEVNSVDLLDVWGCVTNIAGCSHRNTDNGSRQKLLKIIGASISYILYYSMLHLYYCVFLRPFFRDVSLPETNWRLNLNLSSPSQAPAEVNMSFSSSSSPLFM